MAAPEYVPRPKAERPRVYESPPWRSEPWLAERPGELDGRQPQGGRLGYQGPDQGFALKLARSLADQIVLTPGEHLDDAITGCTAVALKRASLFGRAPMIHDLRVAMTVWGYLSQAPPELVKLRRSLFDEVSNPNHYMDLRRIVDVVPEAVLRQTPQQVADQAAQDWRSFFARRSAS